MNVIGLPRRANAQSWRVFCNLNGEWIPLGNGFEFLLLAQQFNQVIPHFGERQVDRFGAQPFFHR
ncbi:MAG: hypothetical protein D6796_01440, partial [Caldilineae bacterium]